MRMNFIPNLPTPKLPHSKADYEHVYEPQEDSFLLLDGLEKDMAFLSALNPKLILEIGPGSGIALLFLKAIFPQSFCLGIDINPKACELTMNGAISNHVEIDVINGNLLHCHRGLMDVILFNPPYVLTGDDEVDVNGIRAAWAGGRNGRVIIDRLLPSISDHLAPNGAFYLITVNENKVDEIEERMKEFGFEMELVLYRVAGWEGLSLLRFTRPIEACFE
jgi:release factor glutamine methyltransferase